MFLLLLAILTVPQYPQNLVPSWLAHPQPWHHHNWLAGQSRGVEVSVGLVDADDMSLLKRHTWHVTLNVSLQTRHSWHVTLNMYISTCHSQYVTNDISLSTCNLKKSLRMSLLTCYFQHVTLDMSLYTYDHNMSLFTCVYQLHGNLKRLWNFQHFCYSLTDLKQKKILYDMGPLTLVRWPL